MEKSLIIGNWKMTLGTPGSQELAQSVAKRCQGLRRTEVWLAPSFVSIPSVLEGCRGSPIQVGAQNAHWAAKGAFTGEISPVNLKELGCTFTLIGHSERRNEMGESSELCVRRALGCLEHQLRVVFCIGERLTDRQQGQTQAIILSQLKPFLSALSPNVLPLVTLAYEPVWAIGTGLAATTNEIAETHALIESICQESLSGKSLPILYGGSVTPENVVSVIKTTLVAGALVGSASVSVDKFIKMIDLSEGN